jgi:hypothetical protein
MARDVPVPFFNTLLADGAGANRLRAADRRGLANQAHLPRRDRLAKIENIHGSTLR